MINVTTLRVQNVHSKNIIALNQAFSSYVDEAYFKEYFSAQPQYEIDKASNSGLLDIDIKAGLNNLVELNSNALL